MKFSEAVKTCFSKYCCFTGRARRSEYWYWVLFDFIVTFVVAFIGGFIQGVSGTESQITNVLTSIVSLAFLLPGLGVEVRRLHDIGKKGWFILLSLIPLVGAIILIVWACKPGDVGENAFGADPKA